MAKPESRRIKAARREDEAIVIQQLYRFSFGIGRRGRSTGTPGCSLMSDVLLAEALRWVIE